MTLEKAARNDYQQVKRLYNKAFPADERAPFFLIRHRAKQGRADLLVAKEKGEFAGFACLIPYQDLAYLFYLAVAEDRRGSGCGSQILALIKEAYGGKRIFLAREQLEEGAENAEERVRRHRFYLKNGFADLGLRLKEANVIYDLMGYNGTVTAEEYKQLISGFTGRLFGKLADMRILDE